jgi:hypothetical protein
MAWSHLGKDIDGEVGGHYSGWATSLTSGGSFIAISAYRRNVNFPTGGLTI